MTFCLIFLALVVLGMLVGLALALYGLFLSL